MMESLRAILLVLATALRLLVPAPHCHVNVVSYLFVGAAGTQFEVIENGKVETYVLPGNGRLELIHDSLAVATVVGPNGQSWRLPQRTDDKMGVATVPVSGLPYMPLPVKPRSVSPDRPDGE